MKKVNSFVQKEIQPFTNYVRAFLSPYAVIPLSQTNENEYDAIVKENDTVTEGEIIAVKKRGSNEVNGASIHSPIPGKVSGFVKCSLPNGRIGNAIKIRLTGSFSYLGKTQYPLDYSNYSREKICSILSEKGVVNTFSETKSLSEQIIKSIKCNNKVLMVRMFDEDPSRSTDSFIANHFCEKVLEGTKIIANAIDAEHVFFFIPKLKKNEEAPFDIENNFTKEIKFSIIEIDTDKYPCGFMQDIIQSARKEIRTKQISLNSSLNRENVFIDPETALSTYEAVVLGIPVIEKFIHVTGSCLKSAGIFRVKIGSTIKSLAEQCGKFYIQPVKIIINGIITGRAISGLDTPVTKMMKSITFLSSREFKEQTYYKCIRCGKCRAICPQEIFPDLIFRHQTGGKPIGEDLKKTANLCSECCLCNCVCPSRLPLSQTISLLKDKENE